MGMGTVLISAMTVSVIVVGALFWNLWVRWQTRRQVAVAQYDLEEQRKTEFALRESERRLATLLAICRAWPIAVGTMRRGIWSSSATAAVS